MPTRILIPFNRDPVQLLRSCLQGLYQIAERVSEEQDATLLIPTKVGLRVNDPYAEVFGDSGWKDLLGGKAILIEQGIRLDLQSSKTFHGTLPDYVVAIRPVHHMIDRIEDMLGLKGIVIAARSDVDVEKWRRTYDPDGPQKEQNNPYVVTLPAGVEESLEKLTNKALEQGWQGMFSDSGEKDMINRALSRMRQAGIYLNADDIEISLRRRGWMAKDAIRVAEMIQGKRRW